MVIDKSNVVGIDMVAGPSELLIVADKSIDPRWVAADLLSQAEHDANSRVILITDDEEFVNIVFRTFWDQLYNINRLEIARSSLNKGLYIIVDDILKDAPDIINKIAPEHLEIAIEKSNEFSELFFQKKSI